MSAKAQALSNALLNAVLRNVAYTSPATVYAALYTTAPTATTAGTEVVTAGGTLYARQAITFGAAALGAAANSAKIDFPVAGADWGHIVAVAVTDNATRGAGNVLYFANLAVPKDVGVGDQLSFAIGQLQVTEN